MSWKSLFELSDPVWECKSGTMLNMTSMLKVWKDTSSRHPMPPGSSQTRRPREINDDDPIISVETSSVGLSPEANSTTAPGKRTRHSSHQDHSDTHLVRSSKRAKTSAPCKHPPDAVTFASADQLLELAKTRNSEFTKSIKGFLLTTLQRSLYTVVQMV